MDEADRFSCKKREKRMFLFFQTISAIINSMQQEKGHTNKEKLKSRFFAKRIWKTKYIPLVMSKSGIFDFFGQINQYF